MSFSPFYISKKQFVLSFAGLAAAAALYTLPVFGSGIDKQEVINLVNIERFHAGVNALKPDSVLNAAAQAKAREMFSHNLFDHYMPDGHSPWQFIREAGYQYGFAGENLAMGWRTANVQHQAWMASPTHRANILNPNYQDIGVAVVEGELEGHETTLVVEFFGAEQSPTNDVVDLLTTYLAKLLGI